MSDSTSDARERPIAPVEVPSCLALWTDGCRWSENLVGEAGAAVYRLARTREVDAGRTSSVQCDFYLKHGRGPAAEDVFDEAARLRWLSAHLPVPTVRLVISSPAGDRVAIRAGDASGTQAADRRLLRTDTQKSREDDVMSAVDETWLLMDALPGQTAHEILASSVDAPATQAQVVDALVAFL
jgi:aminoglycoside phosphotransferase